MLLKAASKKLGFWTPGCPVVKTPTLYCRGPGFDPFWGTNISHAEWCRKKRSKEKISFHVMWISPKIKKLHCMVKIKKVMTPQLLKPENHRGSWEVEHVGRSAQGHWPHGEVDRGEDCPPSSLFTYHSLLCLQSPPSH